MHDTGRGVGLVGLGPLLESVVGVRGTVDGLVEWNGHAKSLTQRDTRVYSCVVAFRVLVRVFGCKIK
jgi:hypothetical protein